MTICLKSETSLDLNSVIILTLSLSSLKSVYLYVSESEQGRNGVLIKSSLYLKKNNFISLFICLDI